MWSILVGALFGGFCRMVAGFDLWTKSADLTAVMTVSFLVAGSISVGYITVLCGEAASPRSVAQWMLASCAAIVLSSAIAALFLLEGMICIIFALPVTMVFAIVGGLIAGYSRRRSQARAFTTMAVLVLPLLLPPLEMRFPNRADVRTVQTDITIHASPGMVWKNIARVDAIRPDELP